MVLRKRPGGAEEPMVAKPKVEEDRRGQLADHGGLGLNSGLTVHSGLKSGLGLTAHSWQTGGTQLWTTVTNSTHSHFPKSRSRLFFTWKR